ncbi:hypothetical protein [Pseudorhodobacter sp.]|uniref:hypothetical protein n=1 Tax=Pseudorhodobacter sp. TaxID=1934400 RepID=UPI002AFEAD4E|nr:hypothetical protein [Pseudorhodobacter sp.]
MTTKSIPLNATASGKGSYNSDWQQFLVGVALILFTGIAPSLLGNSYWEHTFQLVNIYIAVAVIQNFLFVDAGQKSFGQGAILGLGAYGLAVASGLHGMPLVVGMLAGVGAATAGGAAVRVARLAGAGLSPWLCDDECCNRVSAAFEPVR